MLLISGRSGLCGRHLEGQVEGLQRSIGIWLWNVAEAECLDVCISTGRSDRVVEPSTVLVAPSWRAYQEACPWPRGSRGAARPCTPLMPYAHSIFSSLLIDPMAFVHAIGSLDDLGDGESLPLLAVKVKDLKRLYVLCTYGRCTSLSTSRPPFTARQLPRCRPRSWGSFIAGGTTGTGVVKIHFWHERVWRQGVLFYAPIGIWLWEVEEAGRSDRVVDVPGSWPRRGVPSKKHVLGPEVPGGRRVRVRH